MAFRTKCHGYLPSGSKVISDGHTDTQTDRQTGDLLSLLLFLKTAKNINIIYLLAQ
jgi:hypothetical protein